MLYKNERHQAGFTAVEIVLTVALVAAIGAAVYYAMQARSNGAADTATPTASPAATLEYTTKYEGVKFNYAKDFSISDISMAESATNPIRPGNDVVRLKKANGFDMQIDTGASGRGGACPDCKILKSDAVTVLGKTYYLNYVDTNADNLTEVVVLGADKSDAFGADVPGKNARSTVNNQVLPMVFSMGYDAADGGRVSKSATDFAADMQDATAVLTTLRY